MFFERKEFYNTWLDINVDIKHFESAAFRHSKINCFLIGLLDFLCSMWLYVQNDYSGLRFTALDWKLLYWTAKYWFERGRCVFLKLIS